MANIKKLALGLLVAVFAFGFSAFKNVKPTDSKLAPFYYGWDGEKYVLIGESYDFTSCDTGDERCVVISPTGDEPTLELEETTNLESLSDASSEGQYNF